MAAQKGINYFKTQVTRTTSAVDTIIASCDVTAMPDGRSFNGTEFYVRAKVLSYEEDGGNNYSGGGVIACFVSRRAATLTKSQAEVPGVNDADGILGTGASAISIVLNGDNKTIEFHITPKAGNIEHYAILEIDAFQYT